MERNQKIILALLVVAVLLSAASIMMNISLSGDIVDTRTLNNADSKAVVVQAGQIGINIQPSGGLG